MSKGVDTAVAAYLEQLRLEGRSPATIYARRRALARLAAALPVPLLAATQPDLMDWRAGLMVAAGTVLDYVTAARRFYAFAQEAGLRADNPAARLPAPRRARGLPRPIAWDDLVLALTSAPPRIRPWLVLASYCGLRAKEVALLRRECILETLPQPLILVAADATKGRRERTVPLCGFVLSEIPLWQLPRNGWAFRRYDGSAGHNSPAKVSQLANAHLHSAGVGATLHQCRHFFGTETYRAKKDLLLVRDLLGHADVSSTQGYAAWDRPSAVAAVEAIPAPRRLRAAG
jgi:integrase